MEMSITIEKVVDAVELGEGPHWDVTSQKLYYVDINGQKIMRLDPTTGKVNYAYMKDGHVGVVVPVEGTKDKLIAGVGRNVVLVSWDGESNNDNPPIKVLASLDTDRTDTRINDGKCDPAGRFWAGTMGLEVNSTIEPNRGALYLIDSDSSVKKVLSPVSISNGLTWNLQKDVMYYIDSMTRQVSAYDYNNADGSITNKRVIFDIKSNNIEGLPDGMTNDADGNLWVALFNGKAVIQIDPKRGKLLRKIELPVDRITSVAFGGPQLDTLYVTSAYVGMTAEQRKLKPDSGALYSIKGLGVKGCPPNNFKYHILQ
ncbi:regucalcin-like isoform X2 [Phymastichus coffea]|uniref:regucalcin-like isoform X2 n=1 Tax=Phymastichus coffea TaxID=108790 RepID=UPI00273B231E|nr:regucalcin-like isoform X2 [Phymastichus coffea]